MGHLQRMPPSWLRRRDLPHRPEVVAREITEESDLEAVYTPSVLGHHVDSAGLTAPACGHGPALRFVDAVTTRHRRGEFEYATPMSGSTSGVEVASGSRHAAGDRSGQICDSQYHLGHCPRCRRLPAHLESRPRSAVVDDGGGRRALRCLARLGAGVRRSRRPAERGCDHRAHPGVAPADHHHGARRSPRARLARSALTGAGAGVVPAAVVAAALDLSSPTPRTAALGKGMTTPTTRCSVALQRGGGCGRSTQSCATTCEGQHHPTAHQHLSPQLIRSLAALACSCARRSSSNLRRPE